MAYSRREKFSIRKLSVGTVSILLGTLLFALPNSSVKASEQVSEMTILAQDEAVVERLDIASPVTYVADETKEVGYHEVEVEGQAGQLIISETDGVTTAERIEPTASREVYGTKPKVVEEILEKATTEYVANDELEAGQQVVKQEGVDGKKVTTTTYRIEKSFPNEVSEKMSDATYRFISEDFYHIDKSKELPSDQIVIDKLFVESAENLDLSTNRDELSFRERISRNYGNVNFNGGSPTETIASIDDVTEFPTNWFLDVYDDSYVPRSAAGVGTTFPEDITEEQRYYLALYQSSFAGLKYLATGMFYDYGTFGTMQYYSNHALSEELYADAKADFQRLEFAKDKLEENQLFTSGLEKAHSVITEFFQNLTRSYNSNRGTEQRNIDYSTSAISEEDKLWLEEVIQQLPEQLRKNLVDLYVTDTEVSLGEDFVGVADSLTKRIQLKFYEVYDRYTVVKDSQTNLPTVVKLDETNYRRRLREVLLHEIAHVIDSTGGISVFVNAFDGSLNPSGFSQSEEFRAIYQDYLSTSNLRPYHRNNIVEAFAEGFGSYLNNRLFGTPYRRFMTVEDSEYGLNFEVQPEDDYYEEATDVWTPIRYYFDKLYTLLFEQPTTTEVVVDQITTEVIDVQQRIVQVGTKTKVVEQITAYTTIKREDADLLIGEKRVIQVGKDGIVKQTTRYELVDKTTGKVVATTTSEIVQELVEEIIAVGTKVVEAVEPEVETPTEEPSVSEPEIEVPTEETTAIPTEAPVEEEKPEKVVETPTEEPSTAPEVTEEPSVDEPVSEPEVDTPAEEVTAIPTEAPVEEEKQEAVIDIPTEEPSTTPEVTEEPIVDKPVSEPEVETPTEEVTAIPTEAPVEEDKPEAVVEPTAEETGTSPEATEEPSSEEVITEPVAEEEISDKESSNQSGGAGAASGQDKTKADSLSGIGSADRPVITATASSSGYSRLARYQADKTLPNTGDTPTIIGMIGLGLSTLGLVGFKRRK